MRVLALLLGMGLTLLPAAFVGTQDLVELELACSGNWCECGGVCWACCPEGSVPYCDPAAAACGCVPAAEADGDGVALSMQEAKIAVAIASACESCSVSCNDGYYACCNRGGILSCATCKCHPIGSSNTCSSGGAGANECSVGLAGAPEP